MEGPFTRIKWFILFETYKEVIIKMDQHRQQRLFDYYNEHVFGRPPRVAQASDADYGPQDNSISYALHAMNENSLASINDDDDDGVIAAVGEEGQADEDILGDLAWNPSQLGAYPGSHWSLRY